MTGLSDKSRVVACEVHLSKLLCLEDSRTAILDRGRFGLDLEGILREAPGLNKFGDWYLSGAVGMVGSPLRGDSVSSRRRKGCRIDRMPKQTTSLLNSDPSLTSGTVTVWHFG